MFTLACLFLSVALASSTPSLQGSNAGLRSKGHSALPSLAEPFPKLCAGNGDGSHYAAVELMLVVQTLLPVPTFLQSFVPTNVSLLPPSGLYKGFTSSIPSLGTIMALWENGIDVLSEDLNIDDSAFGFSIQRDFPALALPSYSMYLWGRGACWSHKLPHMLTPPLHCVGEGTMFDAPPTYGEVFEAGTGQYPMLEFSSATSGPHHCPFMSIRKSVDANSGYAFLETAMSVDGHIMWQASLVNASTSIAVGDFQLPAQCLANSVRKH